MASRRKNRSGNSIGNNNSNVNGDSSNDGGQNFNGNNRNNRNNRNNGNRENGIGKHWSSNSGQHGSGGNWNNNTDGKSHGSNSMNGHYGNGNKTQPHFNHSNPYGGSRGNHTIGKNGFGGNVRGPNSNYNGRQYGSGAGNGGWNGGQGSRPVRANPTFGEQGGPLTRTSTSRIFSGEGPRLHVDGRDSCFSAAERQTDVVRPFSSAMPISLQEGPAGEAQSEAIRTEFARAFPNATGGSLYLNYIMRCWASSPNKPLSGIHRSYGLKALLEYGDVEEICAEVFHFLCGVLQSRFGDGYMADDMVMCDCEGKVPRCFTAAYIELARKVERLELQATQATALLAGNALFQAANDPVIATVADPLIALADDGDSIY